MRRGTKITRQGVTSQNTVTGADELSLPRLPRCRLIWSDGAQPLWAPKVQVSPNGFPGASEPSNQAALFHVVPSSTAHPCAFPTSNGLGLQGLGPFGCDGQMPLVGPQASFLRESPPPPCRHHCTVLVLCTVLCIATVTRQKNNASRRSSTSNRWRTQPYHRVDVAMKVSTSIGVVIGNKKTSRAPCHCLGHLGTRMLCHLRVDLSENEGTYLLRLTSHRRRATPRCSKARGLTPARWQGRHPVPNLPFP